MGSSRSSGSAAAAPDAGARQDYARGKDLIDRAPDEAESLSRALIFFKKAALRDPHYAKAFAGISNCYDEMGFFSLLVPTEAFPAAKDAAVKALRIDATEVDAYVSLADVELEYDWNATAAENHYRRALALDPRSSRAHFRYAFCLAMTSRLPQAIAEAKKARELNPNSHAASNVVGWILYLARRYDEAIAELRDAADAAPNDAVMLENLADAYAAAGHDAEAFAAYQQWARLAGYLPDDVARLDKAWRNDGMNGYWRERLAMENEEERETGDTFPYRMALLYARVHDGDHVMEWLDRAYEQRSNHLVRLGVEPAFDPMRNDSRFRSLLHRIGISSA